MGYGRGKAPVWFRMFFRRRRRLFLLLLALCLSVVCVNGFAYRLFFFVVLCLVCLFRFVLLLVFAVFVSLFLKVFL